MSHRQTWLIRRDMLVGGSPWGHAWRRCPGFSSCHAFVEGRPAYFVMMACIVAARAACYSALSFAAVLPPSALQAWDPTLPWEPCRPWRLWETLHMTPGPTTRLA